MNIEEIVKIERGLVEIVPVTGRVLRIRSNEIEGIIVDPDLPYREKIEFFRRANISAPFKLHFILGSGKYKFSKQDGFSSDAMRLCRKIVGSEDEFSFCPVCGRLSASGYCWQCQNWIKGGDK